MNQNKIHNLLISTDKSPNIFNKKTSNFLLSGKDKNNSLAVKNDVGQSKHFPAATKE